MLQRYIKTETRPLINIIKQRHFHYSTPLPRRISESLSPAEPHVNNSSPTPNHHPKRIVVAITGGASGTPYAKTLLKHLKESNIETHLITSKNGTKTIEQESIISLASKTYSPSDLKSPITSPTFQHDGMIILPCSMETLTGLCRGDFTDLITKTADACIHDKRKLLLCVAGDVKPLSSIHLDNMKALSDLGVFIYPAGLCGLSLIDGVKSVNELVEVSVEKLLSCFGLSTEGRVHRSMD
ncbi:unnamed protein product [Ambrosiozyma monospora]|uniref:Unnamed protein product n=1 Tax=Ambrosiozyma monospora TaxID=43982 RepID=A0A9W6YZ68_AMBMO|nr:unnamed protein product [Ambrosiozyma monospora]